MDMVCISHVAVLVGVDKLSQQYSTWLLCGVLWTSLALFGKSFIKVAGFSIARAVLKTPTKIGPDLPPLYHMSTFLHLLLSLGQKQREPPRITQARRTRSSHYGGCAHG